METGEKKYLASAGANQVITAQRAFLYRIIIGKDVASAVIEVSDDISDGDGDVQIYLASSTLLADTGGVVEVGAEFNKGICVDVANQTNLTFIFENRGAN